MGPLGRVKKTTKDTSLENFRPHISVLRGRGREFLKRAATKIV